jgi:hypothetical protein
MNSTDKAIEAMQFQPTTPTMAMDAFFALERVRDLQRTQQRNPYGSKMHRWAHDEIVRLAATYNAEAFFGEY